MKGLKAFARFVVEESSVAFVACLVVFSLWATNNMVRSAFVPTCDTWILRSLAVVGLILNVLMIAVAVKLTYDDFKEFRDRIDD